MNEPRTLTEAVNKIATKLVGLGWVDVIYGRVHIHDVKLAGQERAQTKPMAYVGGVAQYEDTRPNDNHKSVVFFATTNPEKSDYSQAPPFRHARNHVIRTSRPLTLYGWVNLSKLPAYDDGSGYAELIKLSLKKALEDVRCVTSIGEWRDGQQSKVFDPFAITDLDTKFDRWPFACFRLELIVLCVETNVNN